MRAKQLQQLALAMAGLQFTVTPPPPPLSRRKRNKIASLLRCPSEKKVIVLDAGPAGCWCAPAANLLLLLLLLQLGVCLLCFTAQAAPAPAALGTAANESAWPPMQHFDIWSAKPQQPLEDGEQVLLEEYISSNSNWTESGNYEDMASVTMRSPKVIHLFAVPQDGECLSDDGRRLGNCLNAYQCRQRSGQAKGECAMGYGVCCVFVAPCNATISNNHTYIVSPEFPSFTPSNFTACQLKVKLMSEEISQIRLDLYHFSLGQPNRRTGICDGDVFNIRGGPSGTFTLCGQNNGQHLYYDVGVRALPRQATLYGNLRPIAINGSNTTDVEQLIEITINLSSRFLPVRLWEIRVTQIPFSQRAPAGCLQYFTGVEGVLRTFNFAENGRHLANQHYRICMRQESNMCSIMYQPCDEQSFRIGGGGSGGSFMAAMAMNALMSTTPSPPSSSSTPASMASMASTAASTTTTTTTTTMKPDLIQLLNNLKNCTTEASSTNATSNATAATTGAMGGGGGGGGAGAGADGTTAAMTTAQPLRLSTPGSGSSSAQVAMDESTAANETPSSSPASDDPEGSGWDEDNSLFFGGSGSTTAQPGVSRRPRPVGGGSSGGFDLLGFLRSALDLRLRNLGGRKREARQFFSTCTDRITMPCIIEDFIGTGLGPLPGCEPIHCGAQFCSSGVWPCRIESTVTPFYIGVHFGDGGAAGKGSAEDNIGACLRYGQVQCI